MLSTLNAAPNSAMTAVVCLLMNLLTGVNKMAEDTRAGS